MPSDGYGLNEEDRDKCTTYFHVFNAEDSEICECGAMRADGTYRECVVLHDENRCPARCRLNLERSPNS